MKFLDRFRLGKLRRFSGTYQTYVDLSYEGESHRCILRWTYHGGDNIFDVDFVGFTETGEDIWNSLDYREHYRIKQKIKKQIFDWSVSVGIKHPFS